MNDADMSRRKALGAVALGAAGAAALPAGRALADQRNMDMALEHLRLALDFLERARPNKDGHRDAAIDLTRRAIEQTRLGIDSVI